MIPRKVIRTDTGVGMSDEEKTLRAIANLQKDVERLQRSQIHPNYTSVADGRISTVTDASDLSNQVDQNVLYYIPYVGNKVMVLNDADNPGNSAWRVAIIPDGDDVLSIDFSVIGTSTNSMYDIGVYWDNGLQIDSLIWTNLTTRATALTRIDGKLTFPGTPTRTYVGTVWVNAANKLQDSSQYRYVWNYYNRVTKLLNAAAAQVNWTTGQFEWINFIAVNAAGAVETTSRYNIGGRTLTPSAGYSVFTDFRC